MQVAGRPVEDDVTAGAWIAAALAPPVPATVASLVPAQFAACARVLHPAVQYSGDDDVDVPWSAVAALNHRTAHRLMQWAAVTGSWDYVADLDQPPLWNDSPAVGHLPVATAARLAEVLTTHTGTPGDCWFGVAVDARPDAADATALTAGPRRHLLVRGPIALATANFAEEPAEQGPSLWWPADHAWCVVSDIDLMATYVAGSADAVAAVLEADGVEAWPAEPGDPVAPDSDPVNPPPD